MRCTTKSTILAAALVLASVAACAKPGSAPGGDVHSGTVEASATFSAPPDASALRPDGTVPWVDQPLRDDELNGPHTPPRTPSAGSKPCRAQQLTGELSTWTRPGNGGETPRGFDAQIGRLIGEVAVRNTAKVECTLRGEAPTTLLDGGQEVSMLYEHGINEQARQRTTVVPAGGSATLRVDWSGPFCATLTGPLALAIELPDGGGTVRAPVTARGTPACNAGEGVKPGVRATLYASGFSEPVPLAPPDDSPLNAVTIRLKGPDTVAAGEPLTFHVVLTNPTGQAIALNPCPGYLMQLYSTGDATHEGLNTHQAYRLNCRPLAALPAGGSVSFEMRAQLPASLGAGRELSIVWELFAPRLSHGPKQTAELRLRSS